jgi:hypothetical protein
MFWFAAAGAVGIDEFLAPEVRKLYEALHIARLLVARGLVGITKVNLSLLNKTGKRDSSQSLNSVRRPVYFSVALLADVGSWQIMLKKSSRGDGRNFPGPLTRVVRSGVREPRCFSKKRPRSLVSALQGIAAAESSKNQLWRDFGFFRFSGFSTVSARNGPPAMSAVWSLSG